MIRTDFAVVALLGVVLFVVAVVLGLKLASPSNYTWGFTFAMLVVFVTMTVLFLMELLIHTSWLSLIFAFRRSMQTVAFMAKPVVLVALLGLIVGSRCDARAAFLLLVLFHSEVLFFYHTSSSFDRNSVLSMRWARFYKISEIDNDVLTDEALESHGHVALSAMHNESEIVYGRNSEDSVRPISNAASRAAVLYQLLLAVNSTDSLSAARIVKVASEQMVKICFSSDSSVLFSLPLALEQMKEKLSSLQSSDNGTKDFRLLDKYAKSLHAENIDFLSKSMPRESSDVKVQLAYFGVLLLLVQSVEVDIEVACIDICEKLQNLDNNAESLIDLVKIGQKAETRKGLKELFESYSFTYQVAQNFQWKNEDCTPVCDKWIASFKDFLTNWVPRNQWTRPSRLLAPKQTKTDYADEVVLATFPCYRHLRFYRYIFVGMLLLNFGLFTLAVWSATSRDSSQTLSNDLNSPVRIGDVDGSASSVVNGRLMTYQICDADVYSLNIGDLAYLMEMTYFKLPQNGSDCGLYSNRPSQLEKCLQMYFSADYTKPELNHQPYNWKVLNMTIPTGSAVLSHNSAYYVAQSAAAKVIVIGIRGSTTGRDWLEDASLYSEISTLQAFSLAVPITALLPPSFIARLVKAMTFMSTLTFNQNVPQTQGKSIAEAYYADVEDVYDFYLRQYGPQGYVFLTVGHSLGGAVAGIVGARNGIRSIGFDPPGMVFSRSKFDISDFSDIVRTATVMVRQYDPVPLVDKHATVQYLDCPASYYDAYCHFSHPISCHLLSNCGLMNSVALDAFGGGYQYCGLSPTEQPSGQPSSTPTSSPTL